MQFTINLVSGHFVLEGFNSSYWDAVLAGIRFQFLEFISVPGHCIPEEFGSTSWNPVLAGIQFQLLEFNSLFLDILFLCDSGVALRDSVLAEFTFSSQN